MGCVGVMCVCGLCDVCVCGGYVCVHTCDGEMLIGSVLFQHFCSFRKSQ